MPEARLGAQRDGVETWGWKGRTVSFAVDSVLQVGAEE